MYSQSQKSTAFLRRFLLSKFLNCKYIYVCAISQDNHVTVFIRHISLTDEIGYYGRLHALGWRVSRNSVAFKWETK